MGCIKQASEPSIKKSHRGGAGEAKFFASSLPQDGACFQTAARIELEPGASIGFHRHEDDEEVYAIVSGEGTYFFDGGQVPARSGDIFTTLRGMAHGLRNDGVSPLVFFAVVAKR